jgi:hypothetical protein
VNTHVFHVHAARFQCGIVHRRRSGMRDWITDHAKPNAAAVSLWGPIPEVLQSVWRLVGSHR